MYADHLGQYWDEVSGDKLDEQGVRKAREEEMEEIYKHQVYNKVPTEECWQVTGRDPIGTKWVDVNEGTVYTQNTGVD